MTDIFFSYSSKDRERVRRLRATFPSTISIVENIPAGLWTVTADPAQLEQVLDSLCMNAREAMPLGGTLTLSVENARLTQHASTRNPWGKAGAFVRIEVADTGRGIPREIIDRIFDPFFTTKQVGQGSGLGLSIAKHVLMLHQAKLRIESTVGAGSTFFCEFPAERLDLPARPASPSPPPEAPRHNESDRTVTP